MRVLYEFCFPTAFDAVTEVPCGSDTGVEFTSPLTHAVAKVSIVTTNTITDCTYAKITYEGGSAFNALTGEASATRTTNFGVEQIENLVQM